MQFGSFDVDTRHLSWDGLDVIGETPLEQAASLCERSMSTLFFLGSGLSQESGLATFRGERGGVYTEDVMHFTHSETFRKDPASQLAWHRQWLARIEQARPNKGHHALARMIGSSRASHIIVTQNVDTLLEQSLQAHRLPHTVHHIHGDLHQTRGHARDCPSGLSWKDADRCGHCDQWLRPDVVWFGEELDAQQVEQIRLAAMRCDVCVLVGTSGVVYPAAALPELAQASGARLIEINTHETLMTSKCDVVIRDMAGPALTLLESLCAH